MFHFTWVVLSVSLICFELSLEPGYLISVSFYSVIFLEYLNSFPNRTQFYWSLSVMRFFFFKNSVYFPHFWFWYFSLWFYFLIQRTRPYIPNWKNVVVLEAHLLYQLALDGFFWSFGEIIQLLLSVQWNICISLD